MREVLFDDITMRGSVEMSDTTKRLLKIQFFIKPTRARPSRTVVVSINKRQARILAQRFAQIESMMAHTHESLLDDTIATPPSSEKESPTL